MKPVYTAVVLSLYVLGTDIRRKWNLRRPEHSQRVPPGTITEEVIRS